MCGSRLTQIEELSKHKESCEMVSLLYDDVFKTMNIFIGDGNDVESVQNLYGVL